uniref:SAM-dependent methyltransferase, MidA family n=1 Tax=Candidatus Kentrum sp. TC TaxID=2126339 RepID=A0A450ZTB8_9GAMM|nr:MAG: SAM-dependent methyltransferase, MidA family [Candidatus Kentron sp. TC]
MPSPDASAMERSRVLTTLIREEIENAPRSMIPFQRFMELALYEPGLGYYQSDAPKFGGEGDFITAPEISRLFSRCVARQIGEVLTGLGGGDVIEVGAGSGIMALDIIRELCAQPNAEGCPPRKYLILERSRALRRLQQATIRTHAPSLFGRFQWLDDLPEVGFRGVIFANELLDAMPIRRFLMEDGAVREWMVGWSEGKFTWRMVPAQPALEKAVRHIENSLEEPLFDGYASELHLAQAAWVEGAARCLGAGLLLLFDYGYPRAEYYHPERCSGTLTCHYRHRLHDDPFFLPGLQDISAHVDFSTIAEAGAQTLELAGFTTQRDFLIATGLPDMCAEMDSASLEYMVLAQEIKQLLLPGEMGDIVKAMGFTRGMEEELRGFDGFDLRGRL